MEHLRTGEICILNKEIVICVYRLISQYTWLLQRLSALAGVFFVCFDGSSGRIIYFGSWLVEYV